MGFWRPVVDLLQGDALLACLDELFALTNTNMQHLSIILKGILNLNLYIFSDFRGQNLMCAPHWSSLLPLHFALRQMF
jgi:hypothetical protein